MVVNLQNLEYPAEVNAFIAWFATNPRRGDALIHQISAREDLARVAVVPLMLTFYRAGRGAGSRISSAAGSPSEPLSTPSPTTATRQVDGQCTRT